jgi:hypothetical protein
MKTTWSDKSLQPTRDGVSGLRSQRRHESVAPPETFASRTVVAVAEDVIYPARQSFGR